MINSQTLSYTLFSAVCTVNYLSLGVYRVNQPGISYRISKNSKWTLILFVFRRGELSQCFYDRETFSSGEVSTILILTWFNMVLIWFNMVLIW